MSQLGGAIDPAHAITFLGAFLSFSLVLTAAAGASTPATPSTRPAIDLNQFRLVWHDEFDGERLDPSRWGTPQQQRQAASRWVSSLVSVRGGMLHLGIRRTDDPVFRYDCGAVRTRRDGGPNPILFQQRYGYFEARCRLPRNVRADYWGAFWLMSGHIADDSPDTRDGLEVDIMESFNFARAPEHSVAFHWNGYGKKHNSAGVKCGRHPEVLDGRFHAYGLYWDETVYVIFLDGVEVGRTDLLGLGHDDNGRRKSNGPCRRPAYLKLTCEAAPWAGSTHLWEKEQPAEDEFVVDYVRVYEGNIRPAQ